MAPRLSIVVPFQNVAEYFAECLESIARQTFADFEVVLVDDGSTDASVRIAYDYCTRDPRFRLLRQEGQGPGHARNTGIRACHPEGEFLGFVDGDDVIPDYSYGLLIKTLEASGSDFVSGNVRMMNSTVMWESPLHKGPMKANKRGTHITRHKELIYDRTVWNKVFRRSFWDYHRIAFPEGVLYEDSWVNMFAHFRAKKVDVLTDFVYYWRRRDGKSAPSITQRHTEIDNLRDRFAAVESVSTFLGGHRSKVYVDYKRWYDEVCLKSDLLIHLKVLPDADQEYREAFMEWANDFLDQVNPEIVDGLPAADRVKWALVREWRLDELLETLDFERKGGPMPVRRRLRRYAALPHLNNRSTGVGKEAYRLDKEFAVTSTLSGAEWRDGVLKLTGTAYIRLLNVHKRHMSRKAIALRQRKGGKRMLLVSARTTYAPYATENSNQNRYCYDWAGFEAELNPERLKHKGRWVEGSWDVAAGVFSRGLFRYKGITTGDSGSGSHPPAVYVDKNTRVLPQFRNGSLKIRVEVVRCRIVRHALADGYVVLYGVLLAPAVPEHAVLRLRSLTGVAQFDVRAHFTTGGDGWCHFAARIPFDKLVPPSRRGDDAAAPKAWAMDTNGWKTTMVVRGRKWPLYPVMADDVEDGHYFVPPHLQSHHHDREIVVHRNGSGYVVLFERISLPVVKDFRWLDDASLEVSGHYFAAGLLTEEERAAAQMVVRARATGVEKVFPMRWAASRFHIHCTPGSVSSLAGRVPLAAGRWDFYLRLPGEGRKDLMVKTERGLIEALPGETESNDRRYELQSQSYDRLSLLVYSAMPDHARGPYRQKLLRTRAYPSARRRELTETVLFDAFKGTQFSDSPRALLEELKRRRMNLRPQWVVRDDQISVPGDIEPVRMWSPQWYESLARSRYVVANNHLPDWFERRDGQVVVQTWHGTPLKKIGHDIEAVHFADKRYMERLRKEVRQWSMLVSPNSFSTPILKRAFGFEGDLAETGYPRNDILRRAGAAGRARTVREWIGLPHGKRVVLYAPTWRDDQFHAAGRYKFDFRIDLDHARHVLGPDHVLLVRRHPNVVDPVPGTGDGFVWDVSDYPDMAELALVTDVLVTDYSSLMFDFANTGRPMLFFTYDLEHYRDTLRGFYFDFEQSAPGPLIRTSEDLIGAIRHIDHVAARYAANYRWFRHRFCDFDDGRASARLLDRMLRAGGDLPAVQAKALPPGRRLDYREVV